MKTRSKAISKATQVKAAGQGVHSVKGATGLYLRKAESGSGSWFYRYRIDDRRREMGLGSLADVSLAQALEKAQALRVKRNVGVDPIEAKREAIAEKRALAAAEAKKVTFAQAARSYFEAHAPSWRRVETRRGWERMIHKFALPVIGDLRLEDIRIEHVVAVMQAAGERAVTAIRVRAEIENILDAALAKGQLDATRRNPADGKLIRKAYPLRPKPIAHYRALALDDAPAAFRALRERACASARPAIRTALSAWVFMIATAARPSEARCARWDEIDLSRGLWTIPAARTKRLKEHVVPLSSIALGVLNQQAAVRAGDTVFPGDRGPSLGRPYFVGAPRTEGIDAGTPHSWRSIFRDWAGDVGRIDRDLAEAALAHSLGATEASYRRRTAIEARRPVMEAYAQWLIGEGANVITFPTRA